jgi:hypothetical protein
VATAAPYVARSKRLGPKDKQLFRLLVESGEWEREEFVRQVLDRGHASVQVLKAPSARVADFDGIEALERVAGERLEAKWPLDGAVAYQLGDERGRFLLTALCPADGVVELVYTNDVDKPRWWALQHTLVEAGDELVHLELEPQEIVAACERLAQLVPVSCSLATCRDADGERVQRGYAKREALPSVPEAVAEVLAEGLDPRALTLRSGDAALRLTRYSTVLRLAREFDVGGPIRDGLLWPLIELAQAQALAPLSAAGAHAG